MQAKAQHVHVLCKLAHQGHIYNRSSGYTRNTQRVYASCISYNSSNAASRRLHSRSHRELNMTGFEGDGRRVPSHCMTPTLT